MGEIVDLKTAKGASSAGTRATTKRSGRVIAKRGRRVAAGGRSKRGKTALVLGGGGFTGGVYEIGALHALDLLAVNSTVNQFDIYVGTSAGAFVGSLCANNVTPVEMMRVVTNQGPQAFRDIDLGDLLRLNLSEFVRTGARLPLRMISMARELLPQLGQISMMDILLGLSEALPTGAYTNEGIESYLAKVLAQEGRTDDFRELQRELYLVATDLDTCERIVLGSDDYKDVPISAAVRASGTVPMVYSPVRIGDRELIDGGIVSTTNLDIAVEAGAELVIVVNPIVPYENLEARHVGPDGHRRKRISDMGFSKIGYQAFKLLAHRRLHELAAMWEDRYPDVDIVLIEPDPTDELMFETSMMNFAARIGIARHGFQSVTYHLLGEFERYRDIWARHGIEISEQRVLEVVDYFEGGEDEVDAWRKILEEPTETLLRKSGSGN
jgi:predicted acylesterase/phospholipase RssA